MKQEQQKPFIKGYKYRIYPTVEQQKQLAKVFGCCRFVYNNLLAEANIEYEKWKETKDTSTKPRTDSYGFVNKIPYLKEEDKFPWLSDGVPAKVLQMEAISLGNAFKQFFSNGKGYPKFKKKSSKQSVTFNNQAYKIENNKVKLLKFKDPIKVKWSRQLPLDKLGSLTITKTPSGKYYISIQAHYIPEKTNGQGIVGIDAGITDLVTFSDGTKLDNPRYYVRSEKKLKRLQQSLSRKKKGSKNRDKARLKVAKCHEKIANQRSYFLHNLTTRLIRENQAIGIERLNVAGMGRNRRLAKHIYDAGWGEMRRQLIYKAVASRHCSVMLADPYFPSTNLCSCCGQKPKQKLKLGMREWKCEFCGSVHQRDVNAGINLELLARYELSLHPEEDCRGKIFLVKSYQDFMNNMPRFNRLQPMESSCAVRHLDEVGSMMLIH